MKKFTAGLLSRTKSSTGIPRTNSNGNSSNSKSHDVDYSNAPADSPEANAAQGTRRFCESGSMENGSEDFTHLPVIVEAAESSPAAAAAAAQQIRKYLTKEWATKPFVQYNAIMLFQILINSSGSASFTRNFDKSFVSTVKEVLRNCRDGSTQQILRETLDNLEATRQYQDGMEPLIAMWRKEKGQQASFAGQHRRQMPVVPGWNAGYAAQEERPAAPNRERSSRYNRLPSAPELASRIEEARNSAKILMQLIQSTPAEELVGNELIGEFSERCQSAQRSMQGYINCDDPAPDDDTMLTLIECNEQLSLSSSRYQRALLTARKALGVSPSPGQHATMGSGGVGTAVSSGGLDGPPRQTESQSGFAPPDASRDQQHPPPTSNGMSAFASSVSSPAETYQAPTGPPPLRAQEQNAFAAPLPNDGPDDYRAPLGPPPSMANPPDDQYHAYSPPTSPPPQHQLPARPGLSLPQSDPFADPSEYDSNTAPLAVAPSHHGTFSATSPTSGGDRSNLPSRHRTNNSLGGMPEHQSTYSPGDTYDPYASSPKIERRPVSSLAGEGSIAGESPERRRGWPSQDGVSEMDGSSERGGSRGERGYRY